MVQHDRQWANLPAETFFEDPWMEHVFPNPKRRLTQARRLYTRCVRYARRYGKVLEIEGAVLLWLPSKRCLLRTEQPANIRFYERQNFRCAHREKLALNDLDVWVFERSLKRRDLSSSRGHDSVPLRQKRHAILAISQKVKQNWQVTKEGEMLLIPFLSLCLAT